MNDTTAEARAYAAARAADYAARAQRLTGLRATAYGTPWTPEDDHYLLTNSGSIGYRASSLGRTYYATRKRLGQLRAARS